jgi:histidinol-phosphate aminotransferase
MALQPLPYLRGLEAYAPGEQPREDGFIKLNTNEFPYPPAPQVIEAIREEAGDNLRRYPSPRCDRLRNRIAQRHDITPDQVFVGNGSDEVLKLLLQAYAAAGRTTAMLEPTYSLYETLVKTVNGNYQAYELGNLEEWPRDLKGETWDVFLLCMPNPPLGTLFDCDNIDTLSLGEGLLILDEAYIEFAEGVDAAYTALQGSNVVRTRTFSKAFGLAGLRIGYAFGPAEVIAQLSKIGDSYNVNRISQAAALAALNAEDYYSKLIDEMLANRAWLGQELTQRGFKVRSGQGNFLFAEHGRAPELYENLKRERILVRHFAGRSLQHGLRISIGTRAELETLLAALDRML